MRKATDVMKPECPVMDTIKQDPAKVVLFYTLGGCLLVFIINIVLGFFIHDPQRLNEFLFLSGYCYVGLGAVVLYCLFSMMVVSIKEKTRACQVLEDKISEIVNYDHLTALPNRRLFFERVSLALTSAKHHQTFCAVFFVDLDHFKIVNDTLGHTVGDALVKDTALKLAQCIRPVDTMARLGGDKFIIFLNSLKEIDSLQRIGQSICTIFNTPRQILGHDLFVTASVGIAIFPQDGSTLEDLLKHADAALYAAKDAGRNRWCFYNNQMNEKALMRMQLERGLRDTLEKSELKIFYQPIINVCDGKIYGFEALLRWFRPQGKIVLPNEFIYIAEDTGLIIPIGEWILTEACRMGHDLRRSWAKDFVMSVNLSVVQLRHKGIVEVIKKVLETTGLPAHCLAIEVTESIFISHSDASIETLQAIRDMGVQISLDDFGTGYASLSHLQRLPITNLKMDRTFTKELGHQRFDTLAAILIDLAHNFNISVTAEGIEQEAQFKNLAMDSCDYFQGFFFGKPMPQEDLLNFIKVTKP